MRIFNIAKAWAKVITQQTDEEAKRRAKICGGCESIEHSKFLDLVGDEIKEVKGFVCGECGCPLVAKVRSNEKCDLKKW